MSNSPPNIDKKTGEISQICPCISHSISVFIPRSISDCIPLTTESSISESSAIHTSYLGSVMSISEIVTRSLLIPPESWPLGQREYLLSFCISYSKVQSLVTHRLAHPSSTVIDTHDCVPNAALEVPFYIPWSSGIGFAHRQHCSSLCLRF